MVIQGFFGGPKASNPGRRLLTALIASLLVLSACGSEQTEARTAKTPKMGTTDNAENTEKATLGLGRMPDFELKDLEGNLVSSAQFKGKVLMVDFWASWCAPCLKEMPHFQELYEQYQRQGFEMVGITLDVDPADVRSVLAETGARYTMLFADEEDRIQAAFGVQGIPTTFIIDREGKIREKIVGFAYKEEFEEMLKELLAASISITSG
ncbi:TlpA family protein disulfide reductase [Acidobacteria bacterium AH-259-G07]|nr:TlpA family protein disulfide reductase [Acidobacteria bacterium AH-259-G07]